MALKVGDLYATMRVDDREFTAGLDRGRSRFEGLKNTIASGARAMAGVFAAGTTAVAALGVATFKVGVDYNRLQQNSRAALTTILGSAEAANRQMDKLSEFASTSPFAREVWITAQQQLLGFGVEAERVIPILGAVGDAVAAVGGSNEQVADITYALAQMQGQGRLTGQTLNQLGQYGIDAATLIGKEMGKSGEEIREMATKPGGIPVAEVWDPLLAGLTEAYEGAQAGLKEQLDGAVDRVRAARRDIGSIMAEPFVDPMGGGLLVDWTNDFATGLRALQSQVEVVVPQLVDRFEPALLGVGGAIRAASRFVDGLDLTNLNAQIDEFSRYTPLVAGLGAAFFALGTQSIPVLSTLGLSINPVVAGIAALVATSPEVRAMFVDVGSALSPLLPQLGTFGILLADTAVLVLAQLTPALGDLLVAGAELAVTWGGALIPAAADLLVAGTPLVSMLADLLRWVAELPAPVQAAALAFVAFRGPISDVASALSGPLKTAFTGARDYMAASRQIAQETGGQISFLGASAGAARAGVANLGTALKTAFLNNALGIAITGITMALSAFATQAAEARQRAAEYRDTLSETGDVTQDTLEKINKALAERQSENWLEGIFGKDDSIIERADKLGVAIEDLQGYILGEAEAIERVNAATSAYVDEAGGDRRAREGREEVVRRFIGLLDDEAAGLGDGIAETERYARATEEGARSTDDATSAVEDHIRAQRELVDQLNESYDANLSAAESASRLEDAHARAADSLDRITDAEQRLKDVQADANATDQDRAAAQRDVERAYRDAGDAALGLVRVGQQHIENLAAQGASEEELQAVMAETRESFIDQRVALGDSREEAAAYADELGLIPEEVETRFLADLEGARAEINGFLFEVDQETGVLTINGDPVPANTTLAQVLADIGASHEDVTIDGNPIPADMELADFIDRVANSEEDVSIAGDDAVGVLALRDFEQMIRRSEQDVRLGANDSRGRGDTARFLDWANVQHSDTQVGANTVLATRDVQNWNPPEKTVNVRARLVGTENLGAAAQRAAGGGMATGGHVADFARALGFADGGSFLNPRRFAGMQVQGPGTPTSDSIPAWLSTTEFVHRGAAVSKYGVDAMYAINSMSADRDLLRAAVGLADGGMAAEIDRLARRWVAVPAAQEPPRTPPAPVASSERPPIVINVYAQPGQSEEQIGAAVARRFDFAMAGG